MRVVVRGEVQGVGYRDATRRNARRLGVMGWVRNGEDGSVQIHAEGPEQAVQKLVSSLREGPAGVGVAGVDIETVRPEGHEQFAIRGVSAGAFVVEERDAGFDLRLEVGGAMRSWVLPKGPSMDPAVRRLAIEAGEREGEAGDAGATVWDRGRYEQGGRVSWPEALDRGHAVFVLHGERLRGGFALQRTRPGEKPQWLLIKRNDEEARPGSE